MRSEKGARRPSPYVEAVPVEAFLNCPVQLAKASSVQEDLRKHVLTKDCMALLWKLVIKAGSDEDNEQEQDEEEGEEREGANGVELEAVDSSPEEGGGGAAGRRRRGLITDSSDEEP
eukprot:1493960-Pleurochrysis_carterae.AAC.1